MLDERTPYLGLPLPHPTNRLDEDVLRLREALTELDRHAQALDELLESDDATMDTLQELVAAIKADKTTIDALLTGKAESVHGHAVADVAGLAAALAGKAEAAALADHSATTAGTATAGHVRLATTAEAVEGTDTAKAATPAGVAAAIANNVPEASTTTKGKAQFATNAEAHAGTMTDRAVTPKQLRDEAVHTANDLAANSYKSAGSGAASTGFKLANDTDIGAIFGKLDGVENTTSGSGGFVQDVALSVNGKNVKMTKTLRAPQYCTYCACNCDNA